MRKQVRPLRSRSRAALPYLAGGLVGGWIGGKLYGRVSVKWLKWLFAGFLFYAGVKYLL